MDKDLAKGAKSTPKVCKILRNSVLVQEPDGQMVRYLRENEPKTKTPKAKKRIERKNDEPKNVTATNDEPKNDAVPVPVLRNCMVVLVSLDEAQIKVINAKLERDGQIREINENIKKLSVLKIVAMVELAKTLEPNLRFIEGEIDFESVSQQALDRIHRYVMLNESPVPINTSTRIQVQARVERNNELSLTTANRLAIQNHAIPWNLNTSTIHQMHIPVGHVQDAMIESLTRHFASNWFGYQNHSYNMANAPTQVELFLGVNEFLAGRFTLDSFTTPQFPIWFNLDGNEIKILVSAEIVLQMWSFFASQLPNVYDAHVADESRITEVNDIENPLDALSEYDDDAESDESSIYEAMSPESLDSKLYELYHSRE